MKSTDEMKQHVSDVPSRILEGFFGALATSDVPPEVTERLRKTIIEKSNSSVAALTEALVGGKDHD